MRPKLLKIDTSGIGADEEEEEPKSNYLIMDPEYELRTSIHFTVHSGLNFDKCAHRLMVMDLKRHQQLELCYNFLKYCREEEEYDRIYGLLAKRICLINKSYVQLFKELFRYTFSYAHHLRTNRFWNISQFFAQLLSINAIGMNVFDCDCFKGDYHTNEQVGLFRYLILDMLEFMGKVKFNERFNDPRSIIQKRLQKALEIIFPRK